MMMMKMMGFDPMGSIPVSIIIKFTMIYLWDFMFNSVHNFIKPEIHFVDVSFLILKYVVRIEYMLLLYDPHQ